MRRTTAVLAAAAMVVTGTAATSVRDGVTDEVADACGDLSYVDAAGQRQQVPSDGALDLAAASLTEVRDLEGRVLGVDVDIRVCGEARLPENGRETLAASWRVGEECYATVDVGGTEGAAGAIFPATPARLRTWCDDTIVEAQGVRVRPPVGYAPPGVDVGLTRAADGFTIELRVDDLGELGVLVAAGAELRELEVEAVDHAVGPAVAMSPVLEANLGRDTITLGTYTLGRGVSGSSA